MAYTRVNWEDLPSTNTPRNATNLNKMDKGIKDLDDGKQDLLVSGTNIKTINNQSILGSGNINVDLYYTNETQIGTWTDGKPLYRQVVTGAVSTSGTEGSWSYSYIGNLYDADKVFIKSATMYVPSINKYVPLSYTFANGNRIYISSIGGTIEISNNTARGGTATIIVEYTKTTDTATRSIETTTEEETR